MVQIYLLILYLKTFLGIYFINYLIIAVFNAGKLKDSRLIASKLSHTHRGDIP